MLKALILAYLVSGIFKIWLDFRPSFINRPAYTRRPIRHFWVIISMLLTWLPVCALLAIRYRERKQVFSLLFVFVVVFYSVWVFSK
jgi:hypothetical protein